MPAESHVPFVTAEEVESISIPGKSIELIRGRVVWVIDPQRNEARVYRSDGSLTVIPADGSLDGEAVVPGFSCALRDVLR